MSKPFDLKRVTIVSFIVLLALLFALEFGPGRRGNKAQEISKEVVAHVGNKKIMLDDVLRNINREIEPFLKDPELAQGYYRNVLDQLVESAFLEQQAPREGITISNSELLAHLQQYAAFHKNGQFDPSTYQKLVQSSTGLTTVAFEKEQRAHIARLKLHQFLSHLSYISDEELYAEYALAANKADVRFVRFSPTQLASQIGTPTPKEMLKFVEENLKAIEETYQQNSHDYAEPERLQLRQIFIERSEDSPEASELAKKKAETLLASLQQGADFASLARESSDDLETKAKGGDLGWKDALGLPPLLASTVFNMKVGEISPPLETPRGYFIYKIEERSESHTLPLQTVQPQIALTLWTQQKSEQRARTEAEKALSALLNGNSLDRLFPSPPAALGNLSASLVQKSANDKPVAVSTGLFGANHVSIPQLGDNETLKKHIFQTTTPGPIREIQILGQDLLVLEVIERQHPSLEGFQQEESKLREAFQKYRAQQTLSKLVQQMKTQEQLQLFPEKLKRLSSSDL